MGPLVDPGDQRSEQARARRKPSGGVAGAVLLDQEQQPACPPSPWQQGEGVSSWPLPWTPTAVADARRVIRGDLMAAWVPATLVETAELLVSELVGNALRHAVGPLRLSLVLADVILCSVGDGSSVLPRMRSAAPDDEWGRGLALVEALSRRWGCYPTAHGKITWFELGPSGDRTCSPV